MQRWCAANLAVQGLITWLSVDQETPLTRRAPLDIRECDILRNIAGPRSFLMSGNITQGALPVTWINKSWSSPGSLVPSYYQGIMGQATTGLGLVASDFSTDRHKDYIVHHHE